MCIELDLEAMLNYGEDARRSHTPMALDDTMGNSNSGEKKYGVRQPAYVNQWIWWVVCLAIY